MHPARQELALPGTGYLFTGADLFIFPQGCDVLPALLHSHEVGPISASWKTIFKSASYRFSIRQPTSALHESPGGIDGFDPID